MTYYFDVTTDRSPSIDAHGLDLDTAADAISIAEALRDEIDASTEVRIRSDFQVLGWLRGQRFVLAPGMRTAIPDARARAH